MKKITFKQLTAQQKGIVFFILVGFSLIILLIPLFYQTKAALTSEQKPIYPTNQKPPTSQTATNTTADSEEGEHSSTNQEQPIAGTPEKVNVILAAQEDKSEENGGESIKTYRIDKPIEKEGLITTISDAAVAKLSAESMASLDHEGEGLIDISFELENKSELDVTIHPEDVMFTIDQKDYPLANTSDLKNATLKKGETLTGTLVTVLPTLKNSEAVKEISFTWKTTTNNILQEYDVLIVLR